MTTHLTYPIPAVGFDLQWLTGFVLAQLGLAGPKLHIWAFEGTVHEH